MNSVPESQKRIQKLTCYKYIKDEKNIPFEVKNEWQKQDCDYL